MTRSGSSLIFSSAPYEENEVTIYFFGVLWPEDASFYVVRDVRAGVLAVGEGCSGAGFQVGCSASGIDALVVNTGDANDSVEILASTPAYLDGGSGNDQLRGGYGNDTLTGGLGAGDLAGREGIDWVT